jgi:nitroreductase
MEFQAVVSRRRMVRAFQNRPLPPGALDRMLDNAVHAPSAGFTQGWAFVVLEGRDETSRLWDVSFPTPEARAEFGHPGLFDAPAVILALSNKQAYLDRYAEPDKGVVDKRESFWPAPYWDIDTGMASLLMLLTAVDLGLGALFFGVPAERVDEVCAAFDVPADYRPIGAVAVGRPAPDTPSPSLKRGRRMPAEVVHRGRWRAGPR